MSFTNSEIKVLASELGYDISGKSKAELVASFLTVQARMHGG